MAVSPQKLAANRENARQSTGPRTPEGKARVRYNPLKHGLLAKEVIVPVGDEQANRARFDQVLEDLCQYYAPVGVPEELLVEKIAICYWRLRRATRAEVGEFRVEANNVAPAMVTTLVGYIEGLRSQVEKASPNADFGTWLQQNYRAKWLGWDGKQVAAIIKKMDRNERKAWLLQALEEKKRARVESERQELERKIQQREAVIAELSLPARVDKILRYETTIDRQMYRAISELERLQRTRRDAASPETRPR